MGSSRFNGACALKLLTIVIGATAYGLGVYSYDETNLAEEYFLRSVQAFLIISTVYFFVNLLSEKITDSELNKVIDIVFHISGSLVLLIVSGFLIYCAVDKERKDCDIRYISYPELFCQFYREKLAAGAITIMNGTLYALVAAITFLTHMKKKSERHMLFNHTTLQPALSLPRPKSFYFGQN